MSHDYPQLRRIYQDGIAAGFEGLSEQANPHQAESPNAAVWFLGFKEGEKSRVYAKSIDNWRKTWYLAPQIRKHASATLCLRRGRCLKMGSLRRALVVYGADNPKGTR